MVVAKRQRRLKPVKIEQRKVQGPEWGLQVKWTAFWLAQFTQGRLRGRRKKHTKRGAKIKLGAFLLFLSFGSAQPHTPQGCTFLSPRKYNWAVTRSCDTGPSDDSNFCCSETESRKLQTSRTYMMLWLGYNLTDTTLAWPLQGEGKTQQKPNSAKAPAVEAELKKTQHSGSDKKSSVLETGTTKTNSAESSHSCLRFQKTSD